MNILTIKASAIAISLAFCTAAIAKDMTKSEYKLNKEKISSQYTIDKEACSILANNANDICEEQAKGKEKVAKADLEAEYKPSVDSRYKASVAKANADFAVSKEKCDDLAGNTKDVCAKEASAIHTNAKADAKLKMKTSDARSERIEDNSDASIKENKEMNEARHDANEDKSEAQYKLAKEKCDVLTGSAKSTCIDKAKLQYGKS